MFRLEGGVIVLEIGLRVKSCKVYELVPLNMVIHIKMCKQMVSR